MLRSWSTMSSVRWGVVQVKAINYLHVCLPNLRLRSAMQGCLTRESSHKASLTKRLSLRLNVNAVVYSGKILPFVCHYLRLPCLGIYRGVVSKAGWRLQVVSDLAYGVCVVPLNPVGNLRKAFLLMAGKILIAGCPECKMLKFFNWSVLATLPA